eukprot:SAG11_NODE_20989_length_434_cov_1.032836_1_plen_27_part_10
MKESVPITFELEHQYTKFRAQKYLADN